MGLISAYRGSVDRWVGEGQKKKLRRRSVKAKRQLDDDEFSDSDSGSDDDDVVVARPPPQAARPAVVNLPPQAAVPTIVARPPAVVNSPPAAVVSLPTPAVVNIPTQAAAVNVLPPVALQAEVPADAAAIAPTGVRVLTAIRPPGLGLPFTPTTTLPQVAPSTDPVRLGAADPTSVGALPPPLPVTSSTSIRELATTSPSPAAAEPTLSTSIIPQVPPARGTGLAAPSGTLGGVSPVGEAQEGSPTASNGIDQKPVLPENNTGTAIGIAVGITAFLAILIGAVVLFMRWKRKKNGNLDTPYTDGAGGGVTNRHLTNMTTQSEIMNRAMRAAYAAENGNLSAVYTPNGYIDEKRSEAGAYADERALPASAGQLASGYSTYGYSQNGNQNGPPSNTRQSLRTWMRSPGSSTDTSASSENPPGLMSMYSLYGQTPRRDTVRTASLLSDKGPLNLSSPPPMPPPPSFLRPGIAQPLPPEGLTGQESRWSESKWSETTSQVFSRSFPAGFESPKAPPVPQTPGGRF